MYGHLSLGDIAVPTGGLADVPGAIFSFRVEEDEMMVEVGFAGTLANTNAAARNVDLQLLVDGTAVATNPLAGATLAATSGLAHVRATLTMRLSKGWHKVKLQGNASGADVVVNGAAYDCRLFAKRVSADAVLAHGEDSKNQVVF